MRTRTTMPELRRHQLPQRAPARVLALGAYLKNSAALLQGEACWWSPLHGDLGEPGACEALVDSARALIASADGPIAAVAHDLHPDFHSTQLAQALAAELGVPAVPVQHHHAHIAVVQAEQAIDGPVIGLALDGVGLGTDGVAWGGEVLQLADRAQAQRWQRLAHLPVIALPGGDIAAREPWRLAASVLHALGRADEIAPRFAPLVGEGAVKLLRQMLDRGLNCPPSTGAGRWFDAAAGLLGLSVKQQHEAEAAIALEQAATAYLEAHPGLQGQWPSLDLRPLLAELADETAPGVDDDARREAQGRGAAMFHLALVAGLAHAATQAAAAKGARTVVLGGGCFFNRILKTRLTASLQATGLVVAAPRDVSCGDAGLALGQAWIAGCTVMNKD
jgi:hydrogenase maturation protein HypF